MLEKITQIFKIRELRGKILFILGILIVFRIAANVPLPGVDTEQLRRLFESNQLLGMLNVFSGGGLSNISIVLLGVGPYITASIIMQLMTMIVPRVEQMYKEEGEAGRQKFNMITRWLTVPLAIFQTFALIEALQKSGIFGASGLAFSDMISLIVISVAGTIFLMWLGELITEKGIGNGVSLIIFAGIVSSLPSSVSKLLLAFDSTQIFVYLGLLLATLITIGGVVLVTEGQRNIAVSYAKRIRGEKTSGGSTTHLPLRVNQAGVIPIIFASAILMMPLTLAGYFAKSSNQIVANVASFINNAFTFGGVWYSLAYFLLIVIFTYFYTAVVFDPVKIAENLQKQGGYIPGIRPGKTTADFLFRIMNRITLTGSMFLGIIAVMPFIIQGLTNVKTLSIGGTSILIVVSVVIETIKQIEGQLVMRDYEGF